MMLVDSLGDTGAALAQVRGSAAVAILRDDQPGRLTLAKRASRTLWLARGKGILLFASTREPLDLAARGHGPAHGARGSARRQRRRGERRRGRGPLALRVRPPLRRPHERDRTRTCPRSGRSCASRSPASGRRAGARRRHLQVRASERSLARSGLPVRQTPGVRVDRALGTLVAPARLGHVERLGLEARALDQVAPRRERDLVAQLRVRRDDHEVAVGAHGARGAPRPAPAAPRRRTARRSPPCSRLCTSCSCWTGSSYMPQSAGVW